MLIDHKDGVWLMGDPHLGRDFRNGTPLHRRGEREIMQREQFRAELRPENAKNVVMVGDLFDKPFVSLSVITTAIRDVIEAAQERPDTMYYFMAGNHDLSRQIGVQAAWQVFELAVGWVPNIQVVSEPIAVQGMMLYPWQWEVTALEQVEKYGGPSCDIAIGHWDMKDFGGDTSHMCPAGALKALNPNVVIYSGHYHEEKDYEVEGHTVHCTGSLQPYAHGEGDMYVTLTADEALAQAEDLRDKCVRILLQPGEDLPEIDCLQLTRKLVDQEAEELEVGTVGLGSFNMEATLEQEFETNEVPTEVRDFIKDRMGAAN